MDLSWFGTIPGMLITGGILLLIIALIIFITTIGKKNKPVKNKAEEKSIEGAKEMVNESSQPSPVAVDPNAVPTAIPNTMPTTQPVADGMPNVAFATPTPVEPEMAQPIQEAAPVQPEMAQPMPDVAPVQPEIAQTVQEVAPVQPEMTQTVPDVAPVQPEMTQQMPEVTPVQPEVAQPMPEVTPVESEMPQVVPNVVSEPINQTVSIYGGVSPSVAKSDIVDTEQHQIYGGANPLENTQSISINDINQAAASQIAAGTEPQIEQVVAPVQPEVTPVVNPTVPSVEPQAQVAVVDVAQPVVEPVNPNNV